VELLIAEQLRVGKADLLAGLQFAAAGVEVEDVDGAWSRALLASAMVKLDGEVEALLEPDRGSPPWTPCAGSRSSASSW
jgi:hypothetical protein